MADLALILMGALLVNNFVLAQFLGLCPFMGVTKSFAPALAMALATTFVLTLAAVASYLIHWGVLAPLGLEWLKIIVFIVVIASVVQGTEIYLRAVSPLLHSRLGVYLPLITTNCAVLGVALLATAQGLSLPGVIVFSMGAAAGFSLVLAMFSAIRERLEGADVPEAFKGAPLALITAGLMSLGFLGFTGLG